jgi:hypothetical protein
MAADSAGAAVDAGDRNLRDRFAEANTARLRSFREGLVYCWTDAPSSRWEILT